MVGISRTDPFKADGKVPIYAHEGSTALIFDEWATPFSSAEGPACRFRAEGPSC
jgi:hypothetical protein